MLQRNKKVLFVTEEGDGTARPLYRAYNPVKGFTKLGWDARYCSVFYEQANGKWNGWEPDETGPAATPTFIVTHMFQTPKPGTKPGESMELVWESQKDVIQQVVENGQYYFFDLDDDVWNVPEWNPAHSATDGISAHLDRWTDDVNAGSGLIVSTPSIAESAIQNGVEVPVYVVRNRVDVSNVYSRRDHNPLRVAYIGILEFRKQDFLQVESLIRSAFSGMRGRIEFWHIGSDMSGEKETIREILKNFPVDIVERPWAAPNKLRKGLTQIDRAILPAIPCKFNDGRSNVVGQELMGAGVPFISSSIREYLSLDVEIACVADNWFFDLRHLVEMSEDEASNWRKHAQEILYNNYGVVKMAEDYAHVFEETYERSSNRG